MTDQRIAEATALLLAAAAERGMFVTGDGRIAEADLAVLLGLHPVSLRNMRTEGRAPPCYRFPVNGSKTSYRIVDAAAWIERTREDW